MLAPFQHAEAHTIMDLNFSSRVTVWLQLFESCTGCQSLRGSSTSCACWFTSRFWDTCRNISQTFRHRLPIFQVDLHCALHREATSSCRGHVNELATEPFLLLHCEHGTGYQRSWNCCDRWTRYVVIWKHFRFILSTAPGYGSTLWCAVGLLVGGEIQVPQFQLQWQGVLQVSALWLNKQIHSFQPVILFAQPADLRADLTKKLGNLFLTLILTLT